MIKLISLITKTSLAFSLFSLSALASSPQAWEKSHQEMLNKCIKASGLKDVKPRSKPILFDDTVGYTALTLIGRYPQSFMNNKQTQMGSLGIVV